MTTSRIRVESGGKREKEESLAGEFCVGACVCVWTKARRPKYV